MKQIKRYPFSFRKHAHDLEYRRNRAMCEYWELDREDASDTPKGKALECLIERLTEILYYRPNSEGIVWLTGKEIGLAKESVIWADNARATANARA